MMLPQATYAANQKLQFYWEGSTTLGSQNRIFTEMLGGDLYCDWLFVFNFDNEGFSYVFKV